MEEIIAELKRVYRYDADTGLFFYKIKRSNKFMPGAPAGSSDGRKGYRRLFVLGRWIAAHRAAWMLTFGLIPDGIQIDHICGIKFDNRIVNLRLATSSQNSCNSLVRKDSESGIRGVTQDKRTGRWRAHITKDGKRRWLGFFATIDRAREARINALFIHGEFART